MRFATITSRPASPFAEIYVSTSLEVAESRDVKGLYAKARNGEITGMTGVDDPYERPDPTELIIDTAAVTWTPAVEQAVSLLPAITEKERLMSTDPTAAADRAAGAGVGVHPHLPRGGRRPSPRR